jgi:ATP-binding cassette subfamily F protein uup
MDQHNAWDFETQYKQILFKLKLEDFKLKVKKTGGQKRLCYHLIIDLIY